MDAKGYALYVFAPDNHHAVTCTGACAGTWPPFMLPTGGTLVAGRGVSSMLLWTEPDPDGGRVVAYDGWPLYTYSGDVQPGQATGQDIDLNGGEWYVLRPSGPAPEIAACPLPNPRTRFCPAGPSSWLVAAWPLAPPGPAPPGR